MLKQIRSLSQSDTIVAKFFKGGSILTIGSLIENIFRFLRNIILVRLLAPDAFGVMAMVISTVAAIEAFSEVGLKQSVIQNKRGADDQFLNITWWMSSLRGLFLFVVATLLAPVLCNFYNRPDALPILRTGFLVILINGLISPKVHVLQKEMNFRKWVFLNQGSGLLGVIVALSSAYFIMNVWALILGFLTEAFLRTLLSFVLCPIKPNLIFNREYFQEITKFSRRMFGLPILMMLFAQTDVFVIGKILSFELLGLYALARSLAEMPNTFLSKIVHPLVLPTLSQIQDDTVKLKTSLLLMTKLNATFGLPLMSFLVVFSGPILSIVYGIKFAVVSIPFGILCVYNFILMSAAFIMNLYIAIGQPNIHRTASFYRTALFLIIIYPATKSFGLIGASLAMLIAMSLLLAIQIIHVRKILGISIAEYLKNYSEGITISLFVVILPGLLFKYFFNISIVYVFSAGVVLCLFAWTFALTRLPFIKKKYFSSL